MHINLTNPRTHQIKQPKVGFSWTTFFFGFFPALFRGDWKWALIIALIQILTGTFTFGISVGVVSIIFAFIYNKLYINDLLRDGYQPSDTFSRDILNQRGFTA
ncbi:DUF2628 domain-containing protein [Lacticaseibacillus sp. GG6-2]